MLVYRTLSLYHLFKSVKKLKKQFMKKLKKLKLNALAEKNLSDIEMNTVKGGGCCNCGCAYENHGGSSVVGNGSANRSHGYTQTEHGGAYYEFC